MMNGNRVMKEGLMMRFLSGKRVGFICLLVVIAAALALIFATRGREAGRTDAPAGDGSLQKVLKAGRLVLGSDATFPPMSFFDDKGEFVGFDIDMMQEVCARMGIAFVKKPINWDDKEKELNSGAIDGIGSKSITPESARTMCLSEPYIKQDLIFVVHDSSKVKWLRDLKGKRIGVQAGSTTQEALETLDIYKEVSVTLFEDNLAILQALKRGELDAAFVDSTAAYYFIDSDSDQYFILGESLSAEEFTIAFRKDDLELRNKVQEVLSGMKADGTLGRISKKWFGSDITIVR